MKRIFACLLAMVLLLGSIPMAPVYAAGTTEGSELTLTQVEAAPDPGLPDHEALFAAYAENLFYGNGLSFFGSAAGARLTGDEKVLYDALVPYIKKIAAGERESTIIGIGQTVNYEDEIYTADVAATFTGTEITQENLGAVMDALLADLPYDLYWYDKVTGVKTFILIGDTVVFAQIMLTVADNYSAGSDFVADTAKTGLAATAAANAKNIVSKYADKTDYEKLLGYKQEICNLVSYDHDAADEDNFSLDNDPWQLIHVFDGNTSTNVVCEGYSKAFMYLCDLTTFSGDVTCYTVTGEMNGGGHMWNIVTIGDKSYLVDVTNSDTGTVGQDGRFFLAGTAGSPATGYTIGTTTFIYDTDTTAIWGTGADSLLALEAKNYTPGDEEPEEDPCAKGHVGETEVRGAVAATCTAEGYTGDTYCLTCGNLIASGTIIPKTSHNYTAVVTAPTCTKEGYTTYTCKCGDTYTANETPVVDHIYENGKCKWCQTEEPSVPSEPTGQIKINSATLALSEDISVLYKATVPAGYSDPYMVFTFNGKEYKITEYTVEAETGRLCFVFPGVTPQCMKDNISATLYATYGSKEYTNTVASYSVLKYCTNQLGKNPDAKLKALLSDLLVYGEKSQLYKNYKTNDLVTAGLSLTPSTFPGLDSSYNQQKLTGNKDANVNWSSASLMLANNVAMRFGIKTNNPENYTYEVTINGKTTVFTAEDLIPNGTGKYYLDFPGIMANQFNRTVTAVIKHNGVQVGQTLTYSVNTYIWKNQADTTSLGNLLRAIYNYGNSAANY